MRTLDLASYTNRTQNLFGGPVVVNLRLGSGAFSLFGKSLINSGYRSGRPDKVGDPDNFDFGIVGSISFSPLENLTHGLKYSGGYGGGKGLSFRPFQCISLVAIFYVCGWSRLLMNRNTVQANSVRQYDLSVQVSLLIPLANSHLHNSLWVAKR
jgi:hypothetical protein